MKDVYKVITPENIELDYEIAGIGSRFLALAVDTIIQWLLIIGILSLMNMLELDDLRSKITHWSTSLTGSLLIALLFMILIGYYIILETVMNGQTVGKKLVNIRVRKEGGYAPSFWDILLRNLLRLADFLPFFYGFGLITMFFNKKAKRLGDYAAGTVVVKELPRRKIKNFLEGQVVQTFVPTGESAAIIEQYPWLYALAASTTQPDYLLIKDLYARRNELTNAQILARTMVNKMLAGSSIETPSPINDNDILAILAEIIVLYENNNFNRE